MARARTRRTPRPTAPAQPAHHPRGTPHGTRGNRRGETCTPAHTGAADSEAHTPARGAGDSETHGGTYGNRRHMRESGKGRRTRRHMRESAGCARGGTCARSDHPRPPPPQGTCAELPHARNSQGTSARTRAHPAEPAGHQRSDHRTPRNSQGTSATSDHHRTPRNPTGHARHTRATARVALHTPDGPDGRPPPSGRPYPHRRACCPDTRSRDRRHSGRATFSEGCMTHQTPSTRNRRTRHSPTRTPRRPTPRPGAHHVSRTSRQLPNASVTKRVVHRADRRVCGRRRRSEGVREAAACAGCRSRPGGGHRGRVGGRTSTCGSPIPPWTPGRMSDPLPRSTRFRAQSWRESGAGPRVGS